MQNVDCGMWRFQNEIRMNRNKCNYYCFCCYYYCHNQKKVKLRTKVDYCSSNINRTSCSRNGGESARLAINYCYNYYYTFIISYYLCGYYQLLLLLLQKTVKNLLSKQVLQRRFVKDRKLWETIGRLCSGGEWT